MKLISREAGRNVITMEWASVRTASLWRVALHRLVRDSLAVAALVVLAIFIVLALATPWLATNVTKHQPNSLNLMVRFRSPSRTYWLGTDDVGRDVMTRLLYGARISLGIGALAAVVSVTLGSILGVTAGYFGKRIDDLISALINTLLSIPTLFLLILLAAFIRPSPAMIALIIGFVSWMGVARLVRGGVLAVKPRDYVTAAQVLGATKSRLIILHILPNVSSTIIVSTYIAVANAILAESALSFLGLGVQPPAASWGTMLENALTYLFQKPFLIFPPGIAIFITVLCLYILGDGLRDALDPQITER